jgi:glycosyltransferase involved in cell wall biosynthesis
MKADLVVFAEDWGRHPSSTQHLMKRLSQRRRVLWINSIGMRRPRLDMRDASRVVRKAAGLIGIGRSGQRGEGTSAAAPPANITVRSVAAIPVPGSGAAFAINRRLLGWQLRQMVAEHGLSRPVLWTSLPTALPAAGEIGERALVYYCGDDFGALAGVDHAPVLEMESRLVDKADLVLAASDVLATRMPADKTQIVPHGADIALFARPAPRAAVLPETGRVAGFYGSLSDWIDVPLIASVARRMPDWTFLLVGPVQTDLGALNGVGNVSILPPQPHDRLPGLVQHWDVSLIPFRDCQQIRACNPLKLREYLAAGTPIATTDFPALGPYRDLVALGGDAESFAAAVRSAAADSGRDAMRRARVAGETWDARAEEVDAALDSLCA